MKKEHQYNFQVEHAKPIFTNIIGSKLVGCDNVKSDIDTVTTYAHKTILNPFFNFPSSEEIVNISYTDNLMYEDCAVLAINNIAQLIRPNDISASTTGWLIHHLAAIKFDRIQIHDQEYYSVYLDYLCSPGLGQAFWKHAAQQTANSWNAMPTSENNWSQHFDSNNQTHIDNKNTWQNIVDYYPTVDKTVGYDCKFAAWVLTDWYCIKAVLMQQHLIDQEEIDFLKAVKDKKVVLEELKQVKTQLWKQVRKAVESPMSRYLLGDGYDINMAYQNHTFGIKGFLNTVENLESK